MHLNIIYLIFENRRSISWQKVHWCWPNSEANSGSRCYGCGQTWTCDTDGSIEILCRQAAVLQIRSVSTFPQPTKKRVRHWRLCPKKLGTNRLICTTSPFNTTTFLSTKLHPKRLPFFSRELIGVEYRGIWFKKPFLSNTFPFVGSLGQSSLGWFGSKDWRNVRLRMGLLLPDQNERCFCRLVVHRRDGFLGQVYLYLFWLLQNLVLSRSINSPFGTNRLHPHWGQP
jgi:hypothetical protein